MSIPAKPLTRSEFEVLKKRTEKNKEAVVDQQVVLSLIATVEHRQECVERAPMGWLVETWS
jgi:hypothetical protein